MDARPVKMRVAAVVVTHDRLPLLTRCITSLRAQTVPLDEIVVVDNDSGTETRVWLAAQRDLHVVHQANSGCAGGFDTGLRVAYARRHDWMWALDDDCYAAPEAFAALLQAHAARPDGRAFNSLSRAIQDPLRPATGGLCIRTRAEDFRRGRFAYTLAEIEQYADADGLVDSLGAQLFHGTWLHRSVVEQVGTPVPELYTCGDEIEYSLRIMRAGYHFFSVAPSVVYHPALPIQFLDFFGHKFPSGRLSAIRRYYSIRNSLYIRREYYSEEPFFLYAVRRLVSALVTELLIDQTKSRRERLAGCIAAVRGLRDGLLVPSPLAAAAQAAMGTRATVAD